MKFQTGEIELSHGDMTFRARYYYEPDEPQTWNGLTGVGHPGSPASASIEAVDFGSGWESPDNYPQLDLEACEVEILERIDQRNADDREEADAEAWLARKEEEA